MIQQRTRPLSAASTSVPLRPYTLCANVALMALAAAAASGGQVGPAVSLIGMWQPRCRMVAIGRAEEYISSGLMTV
ncbi:MAG TPA: hypothetical protein VND64_33985 [Pirellulales bacterium]|nr:hypothetical protein [Pirellulales bacterium]